MLGSNCVNAARKTVRIIVWFALSPAEKRETVLQIRAKIKDIMMKAKDRHDISTLYVRQ